MYKNNIIKFLGIEEANVKNVKHFDKTIEIFVTLKEPKPKSCPHCGCKILHYHDKRVQKVKDIPYQHKQVNFSWFFISQRLTKNRKSQCFCRR